jgi:TolB-like protein
MKLLREIRQRQLFQVIGLYIFGAWAVIEVASVFFPAWGIPDTSLRYLFMAAASLFPIVVLFGWLFDVRRDGLFRSIKGNSESVEAIPLRGRDYASLGVLTSVSAGVILVSMVQVWISIGAVPDLAEDAIERIENSVAVLPFRNLDPNPDSGYFSDGVSEEILHRLSAIRALHVLGWASARVMGESDVAPAEISERLGVEYLLHGSIRRDGDYVRVTARLMDSSGLQIWSQTFDRKLEAIFVIQSEIASSVASQIVAEIVSSGGTSVLRATDNMDAYNEYLVGRALTHARGEDWDVKSEAAFRRAIELDAKFGPAYAGLAYSLIIMSGGQEKRVSEALDAANKSLELDPQLALGHAMLGVMQGSLGITSLEEAEQRLRRALELDPALSDAYNWLSLNLQRQGRLAEADAVYEQGYMIDPLLPTIASNLAYRRAAFGEFERAMRILEPFKRLPQPSGPIMGAFQAINFAYGRFAAVIELNPDADNPIAYVALGLNEQANLKIEALRGNPAFQRMMREKILRTQGRHDQLWALLQEDLLEHNYDIKDLPPNDFAEFLVVQVLSGDYAGAIEEFESFGDGSAPEWIERVDGDLAADVLNAIGFAYLQTGDAETATSLLAVETARLAHYKPWLSPLFLEPMALNAALRGDDGLAYERLSLAVDKGWANYYHAINDPRWGDTLSQPRFAELLERVQADIAQQRADVEAMLASQPGP